MKVVKEGNWTSPWSYKVICPDADCGATLLVEEKDVKAGGYRHDNCESYHVDCPVCGSCVDMPISSISPRVKRVADARRPIKHYDD